MYTKLHPRNLAPSARLYISKRFYDITLKHIQLLESQVTPLLTTHTGSMMYEDTPDIPFLSFFLCNKLLWALNSNTASYCKR